MTVAASDIARLRRMASEPDSTNGYSDSVLTETIERYPVDIESAVYDLNAAAADVWTEKAAALAVRFDFTADGSTFHRSQAVAQARAMAIHYRSRRYAKAVALEADINDSELETWIGNLPEED